jgi:peptidoglycan hydrolase-like protein with peptidoglycan-binding domain
VSATSSSSSAAKTANKTHTASTGKRSRRKSAKTRGQQKIDSERAQAIQEALIREHYLTGEATGKWNESSEAAMRKYQADHGWQSKTVPDSRALISLGLGPSKDHLLNPESAMTSVPDAPHAASRSTNPPADAAAQSSNPSDPRRPQ